MFFIFSLKIIPHWTVDSASDPDSEWLLHVMTPHFPTKKASETAQWPTLDTRAALKSWSQHSFKPLSDKLDFQPFDWSKKKGSKKSYLTVEKPTASWFSAKSMSALLSDLSRRSRSADRELAKARHIFASAAY